MKNGIVRCHIIGDEVVNKALVQSAKRVEVSGAVVHFSDFPTMAEECLLIYTEKTLNGLLHE
jgi:hypothetical protein